MKKTTLMLIDDHKLVREMVGHLCALNDRIEVLGLYGELDHAIQMIHVKQPDIVLLDINMPPRSGLDAVPEIKKNSPATRIIGMSMYNQPTYARKMMQLGASGYITKNSSPGEIFTAIEEVMNDRKYICREIKQVIAEQAFNFDDKPASVRSLSLREIDIIKRIKNGCSSKEIADQLGIAVKTVEVHRYNILKKLNLKNAAALINFMHYSQAAELVS